MASELGVQTIQHTNGTDALTIDSAGHTKLPNTNRSVFKAYKSSNSTISNNSETVAVFDTEDFDLNSTYDTSNGRYTPAKAGYYQLNESLEVVPDNNEDITLFMTIKKNGSTIVGSHAFSYDVGSGADSSVAINTLVYSDGNDYFDVRIYHYDYTNTSSITLRGVAYARTAFSGFLVEEA